MQWNKILWIIHFLAEQGMHIPTSAIYHNNKSTVPLAENSKTSISIHTCHLNVQLSHER